MSGKTIRTCRLVLALIFALSSPQLQASIKSARVALDYVLEKARERAEKPFHSPRGDLPKVLQVDELDYDKYRLIQFRQGMALWSEENLGHY